MLETGIGRAANLAFARLTSQSMAHDLSPSHRYFERDILQQPIEMDSRGFITVTEQAGIGVQVDEARLEALCLERTRLARD
jgi:O-succinylbenzoate synthase